MGASSHLLLQGSYAMGYNLAIEYLADFEKTWMLESFKELNGRVLQPQHRELKEWLFLEVCSSLLLAVALTAHSPTADGIASKPIPRWILC